MNSGAVYYNCYYPGPIGLPGNTAFDVFLDGRYALLHLVRHLRPVVITDFGNDFTHVVDGERRHLSLKREIPVLNPDMLTVDMRNASGEVETIAAYGYAHEYTQLRRQSFSEFTLGIEVSDVSAPDTQPDMLFRAIEKLILLYRTATTDTRPDLPSRLRRDVPVIREAFARFSPPVLALNPQARLLQHLPRSFQPRVFSYKEYENFLPVFHHDVDSMAVRIGHHLAVDTQVSEAQQALVDSFDLLVSGGSPRFALVEAMSVGELLTFELLGAARKRLPGLDARLSRAEKKNRLTFAKALGYLPDLLSPHWADFDETLTGLFRSLERRNKALHKRAIIDQEEARSALNYVQQLIFAIEAYDRSVGQSNLSASAPRRNISESRTMHGVPTPLRVQRDIQEAPTANRITLDYVTGFAIDLDDFPVKNLHALSYMPAGLQVLASTVREYEKLVQRRYPGLIHWAIGAPGVGLITNAFGWFSVSLISYLRFIRLLALMLEHDWVTADLKNNRRLIRETCLSYIQEVAPAVYRWRNKVAAHPAFTDPFADDTIGTLELSVMIPVTFRAPYYWTGELQWHNEGEGSEFTEWSLTQLFEQLRPRFWPDLRIEPLD